MAEDEKVEAQVTPHADAARKKIATMLAIIIVFQAIISILSIGLFVNTGRMQGDIAKLTVLVEEQLRPTPAK